jgi:hypothetical protein
MTTPPGPSVLATRTTSDRSITLDVQAGELYATTLRSWACQFATTISMEFGPEPEGDRRSSP